MIEEYKKEGGIKMDNSTVDMLQNIFSGIEPVINKIEGGREYTEELSIKYRWVLDALIITCVKKQEVEQLTLVVQFCEALEITKNELKYIATMASAIISMSETKYVDAYEIKVDTIPDSVFSDYMYLISKKCIISNGHMTIFQPTYENDVTVQVLEQINKINTPYIKIIGAIIHADDYKLVFKDKEKVSLENCTFIGGYKNAIFFNSCKEVMLSNCRFENFSNRTLVFDDSNLVVVDSCLFKKCNIDYDDDYYWVKKGSVFYSEDVSSIGRFELINSSLIDCGVSHLYDDVFGFISNIDSFVDNCSFENCLITKYGRDEWKKGCMFTDDSFATNCNYKNSSVFN